MYVCVHPTQCINCCFISRAEALTRKTTAPAEKTKRKIMDKCFICWCGRVRRPVSAFTPRSQRDGGNLCIRSVKLSKNNDKHLCACVCVFAFSSFVVVPQLVPCPFLPLFSSNCQIFLQTKDVLKNREREIVWNRPRPHMSQVLLQVSSWESHHHPPTQVSGVLSDSLTFYPLYRAKGNRWLVSTSSVRGRRSLIWWTKQPCGWWCNRVQTAGFQISKSKEKLINAELIPTETWFKHD